MNGTSCDSEALSSSFSSSSSFGSSESSIHTSEDDDSMQFHFPTALIQRRRHHTSVADTIDGDENLTSSHYAKRRKQRPCFRSICSTFSTVCLVSSFLLWVSVSFLDTTTSNRRNRSVFDNFRGWDAEVKEALPSIIQSFMPDCTPEPWHADQYPNCNDVHTYRLARHLANGLWRDVFILVNDYENAAVLKMMKEEHQVTTRNFDRHRRDAVVMEQLAGSPYVVDIYGYCGNTVLTERISPALDELVIEPKAIAPLPERVLWARDMARGLAALHEKGIVHADLQAKQFLWKSEKGVSKINDFNRCRFLERANPQEDNSTVADGSFCPMRISSAPGKQRSPEEYSGDPLTEKLDIYSYANILMALWTGHKAWDDYASAEAKRLIKDGFVPPSPFSANASAQEHKLWELTVAAYARDPEDRPSAHELAAILDRVLQELTG